MKTLVLTRNPYSSILNHIILFAIFVLLFPVCSLATLDLELTQGVAKAIPIAIVPFHGVSEVVRSDLQNSGQFSVSSDDDIPNNSKAINYDYWRSKKINDVVIGKVSSSGFGYRVNFQLVDIYNRSVLLNEQFHCSGSQLRALAHNISNLIYKQLTGVPGIFATKIAYVLVQRPKNKDVKFSLMVADQDGGNPQSLLISHQPIMSPSWSPDGKQIAYVSFENNRSAIYMQNIATGKRHLVTKYPGINGAPAWSPDGNKMAFVLTKTGFPKIYTLDLSSGKLTQVTFGYALDTEPCWAPDGKSLIFTSNREGGPQIYSVDLYSSQSNAMGISNNKVMRLTYKGNYNARASFTSDGKKIVMLHREDGLFTIATQDLKTGRINLLTTAGMSESPSIAPNGTMIVYATNYGGRGILAEVAIDGSVKLRLPAQDGEVQEPAWGP